MVELIRYLRGYVKIKVWGYSPERFMNLCTNHHIMLWGMENFGDYYTMYLSLEDFFSLKTIVKKTRTRVAVLEKAGLPFFIQKMKKRKVFAFGVPSCILFLLFMSRFIWAMDFQGNVSVTDDVLKDFLRESGVDYGIRKNNIDMEALESAIREEFPIVTWTSGEIQGTRLIIKIKENDLVNAAEEENKQAGKEEQDTMTASNLVADCDGVVYSILTRNGVPQVKAGSEVKKGDLLVSGAIPVTADDGTVKNYQYCNADADIFVRTSKEVSLRQDLTHEYQNYTGREKKIPFFTVNGKRYTLPGVKCKYLKYDEVVEESQFCLFGQIDLPFYTGTITCREYLPVEAYYEKETAETLLYDKLDKIIVNLEEKGVQIITKDVKIEEASDFLTLQGTLSLISPCGVSQELTPSAVSGNGIEGAPDANDNGE